ncbi:hypothetical protein [Marinococcus luteus]|uniref:hypothetical protein n=1 Tax=Marinococcus luteus TaxID=1122204 RepID=UPI002ACC6393|nr:hypothetical protein [Marinococcus luteus]MDZ5784618.1 hypothetical protein [Marinococcus luteus]
MKKSNDLNRPVRKKRSKKVEREFKLDSGIKHVMKPEVARPVKKKKPPEPPPKGGSKVHKNE